jgi:hypothetical protein
VGSVGQGGHHDVQGGHHDVRGRDKEEALSLGILLVDFKMSRRVTDDEEAFPEKVMARKQVIDTFNPCNILLGEK